VVADYLRDQAQPAGVDDGLDSSSGSKLGEEVLQVAYDGVDADAEPACDPLVAQTLCVPKTSFAQFKLHVGTRG
jgi:hypothetical protein